MVRVVCWAMSTLTTAWGRREIMKGLAFRPPYGLAVFHGKDIENRSMGTRWNHQGWLLVYASKTRHRAYYDAALPVCRANGWEPPAFEACDRGVILGAVWMELKTWHQEAKGWGFAAYWWHPLSRQTLFTQPIPFVPKFGLGLFDVPDALVAAEMAQIDRQYAKRAL